MVEGLVYVDLFWFWVRGEVFGGFWVVKWYDLCNDLKKVLICLFCGKIECREIRVEE